LILITEAAVTDIPSKDDGAGAMGGMGGMGGMM
jgi:chaperonin GroEL